MTIKRINRGMFFVQSAPDSDEHIVDLREKTCTCRDDACRCLPKRRAGGAFIPSPSPDRTVCKHITAVLIELGREEAKKIT
jgi:hypothetical protein